MTEPLLLQMEWSERMSQYRALIRQSFAKKRSVMLVVPTIFDLERVKKEVSKGIEKHPMLFITTPAGSLFSRKDLGLIILERENSRAYRTLKRPYMDYRVVLEILAKEKNLALVLGDSVLSVKTLHEFNNDNSLVIWRLRGVPTKLVDARAKQDEGGRFEIISEELKVLIEKALSENEQVFLYGTRKGLFPTTVCGDCGTVLPCLNCGAPVVLHASRIYLCHACGDKRESETTCGHCGSWKLVPLGIGTEEIARQVKNLFPNKLVRIIDSEHKKFNKDWDILIGTEMAFYHLESVPYSGLVSVDSLFSIPDFSINERVFYLVSRLREITEKECLIQTRNIGKQVLGWAASGNIIDFYNNEIRDREVLLYPPFSIFIKIIGEKIPEERFLKWQPERYKDSLIIRVKRESWPDQELSKELALLGPQFIVKVDPETIL